MIINIDKEIEGALTRIQESLALLVKNLVLGLSLVKPHGTDM